MKSYKNIIALILSCAMVISTVGCSNLSSSVDSSAYVDISSEIDTSAIAQTIIDQLQETETEKDDPEQIVAQNCLIVSDDWEDYIGDINTFVTGLIISDLRLSYDVFPAYVTLDNGQNVFGIGYTDYSEGYTNEEETEAYFTSGFISSYGDSVVPSEQFDSGLLVHNMDYEPDGTYFLLGYQSTEFLDHCVVYGQYVKFGVNNESQITYQVEEYIERQCDESLGALYSYDDRRYLYDDTFGEYQCVSGESLVSLIDYNELINEINKCLDEQDINMLQIDTESSVYLAQEAVCSYLLSLQEEAFLGYDVSVLIEEAEKLDPLECFRITDEGLITIDIDPAEIQGPSALAKWIVGVSCVIVAAVGIVGSMIFIECPALSALAGAMTGASIEIFMEVIIQNKGLDNIEWSKVAVAAVSGAVCGFIGPYVQALTGGTGVAYFLLDTSIDGIVGGIEQAVYAWMDGESGKDILKTFGTGVALGFAMSAAVKGAVGLLGAVAKTIKPGISKLSKQIDKAASGKISKALSYVGNKIDNVASALGDKISKLKQLADSSIFHSKYISDKLVLSQVNKVLREGSDELKKKSFDSLRPSDILDVNGNEISKPQLKKIFDTAKDGSVIGKYKIGDEIVDIKKMNGVVGVFFDEKKYQTVVIDGVLTNNRDTNFLAAAKKFKEIWSDNADSIPSSISKAIQENGVEIDNIRLEDLVDIIQSSDMVFHENIDMKTITLVSRAIHDKANATGVAHMGGYALAEYLKTHMVLEDWGKYLEAATRAA